MDNFAPISIFVYNRPYHVKLTVEHLCNNDLSEKSDVIIFSDGPKNEDDIEKVKEIREYLKTLSCFKSIRITERKKNFGIYNNIVSGVTEIIKKFGKIIVLEDDIITSRYFLKYMNDALDFYEDEEKVISIQGYVPPIKKQLPYLFFLKFIDSWGWATWKRGWDLFESNAKKLLKVIKNRKLEEKFNLNNAANFTRLLERQINNEENDWDIRFYASIFLKNRLSLYPCKSFVNNIGFDGLGVHCRKNMKIFETEISMTPIQIKSVKIEENRFALQQYKKFYKRFHRRLIITKLQEKILNKLNGINIG